MLPAVGSGKVASERRGLSARRSWITGASAVVATLLLAIGAYSFGQSRADAGSARPALVVQTTTSTSTTASTVVGPTSTTVAPVPEATSSTTSQLPAPEPAPVETATAAPSSYVFPVVPASAASYGRSHHDYPAADIFAPCGSEVVAPSAGTVQDVSSEDRWNSTENTADSRGGLSFSIVGDDGVRYYGSHLRELDPVTRPGSRVATGQRIGSVGDTGNAAGTGCHLHFGISTPCGPGDVLRRRGEFWPQEYLDAWKRSEPKSPADLTIALQC